jgi:capsular polysaccharide export protein
LGGVILKSRVLLLQGPPGPFFFRLAQALREQGSHVWKINFNGGDFLFFNRGNFVNYGKHPSQWEGFLREFIAKQNINRIMCYGDSRWHHQTARRVAEELGIDIWVCEEGYLRPDYVTMETFGVNANTRLALDWPTIEAHQNVESQPKKVVIGNTMYQRLFYFVLHDLAAWFLRPRFPHYKHHRPIQWVGFAHGFLSFARWLKNSFTQRPIFNKLCTQLHKQFYLIPLQVHFDCQLTHNSNFSSMEEFIAQVATSFAQYAPKHTHLVFKHHPVDRGQVCYRRYIQNLAINLNIENRVHYVHDLHLPTLLKAALGVVTINSTVGLSSLHHSVPTKTLGRAFYNLLGLVSPSSLNAFWNTLEPVDDNRVRLIKHYLLLKTQVNGNFFKELNFTAARCAEHMAQHRLKPITQPAAHASAAGSASSPAASWPTSIAHSQ